MYVIFTDRPKDINELALHAIDDFENNISCLKCISNYTSVFFAETLKSKLKIKQ